MRDVWGWVLSLQRPPVLSACSQGSLRFFLGRGGCWCGRRSRTPQPHSCKLRLHNVWVAGGHLWGGGASRFCEECAGWGTLSPPNARPLGRKPEPAALLLWARRLPLLGPVTEPTAHNLGAGVARRGGRRRAFKEGRLAPACWACRVGHSPSPNRSCLGRKPGACRPLFFGSESAGVEARHQSHSARSGKPALRAMEAAGGRPWGGGGASFFLEGYLGLATIFPPTARPSVRQTEPAALFPLARGLAVWGPVTDKSWLIPNPVDTVAQRPSRQFLYHPSAPVAPGPSSTRAPARATVRHTDAPTRAQRHGPPPTMRQPQGQSLAQTLGGAHHQATTAGLTDLPTADRTQAVTDTSCCTPPGPRDPETHAEARTTGNRGALPTSPASPRWGNPTENTGAGLQETAEGNSREELDSRNAEQLAIVAAERATVPATHPAIQALPATPPALTSTTHPRIADHLGTERLTDYETPGTGRPGTDEERPRDPQQPTSGAHAG